jgi:hypothetical protein
MTTQEIETPRSLPPIVLTSSIGLPKVSFLCAPQRSVRLCVPAFNSLNSYDISIDLPKKLSISWRCFASIAFFAFLVFSLGSVLKFSNRSAKTFHFSAHLRVPVTLWSGFNSLNSSETLPSISQSFEFLRGPSRPLRLRVSRFFPRISSGILQSISQNFSFLCASPCPCDSVVRI